MWLGQRCANTLSLTNQWSWLMSKSLGERFWEKVNCAGPTQPHMSTCCWEWTACRNQDGYGRINLGAHHGRRLESAHRLSLSFVLGHMPNYVMHRCDNPACVRPSHLKEGTHKENVQESYDKGRQPRRHAYRGANVYNARFTENDILEIRKRYEKGETQKAIGESYGVSQSHIGFIVRRKMWAHVK